MYAHTYTESEVARIDEISRKLRIIADQQDALEAHENSLRDELLAIVEKCDLSETKVVLPGVQVVDRITYEIDKTQILDWIFADTGTLMTAAPLLTVNKGITAVIVGQAIADPSLRRVLDVDTSAVQKAIANGTYADLPHGEPTLARSIRIVVRDLKTGDELRRELDIVPDEAIDEEATA